MWWSNLKLGTFKDKIVKEFQQMYPNHDQTKQIWTHNDQPKKKNVRTLSPM